MAVTPGPWTSVNGFRQELWKGVHNITAASTYKVAFVTAASNISDSSTTWAGVTGEVANGNGYVTGGFAVDLTVTGTKPASIQITAPVVCTASGGSVTARTAVLYKIGGNVISRCALDTTAGGTDVTAADGENITVDSDGTPSPVFIHG